MNTTPSINLPKLKALATAAAKSPYDAVALNDYGMAVPPATVLDLIAEIERHRLVDAEGCKPESSLLHFGMPCAGAALGRGLDKAEGCNPDLNTLLPHSQVAPQPQDASTAHNDHATPVTILRIRESMEESAIRGGIAELQIGAAHVRVTYHGIKWHHDMMRNGRWEPLAIEEFDEILCSTLKHEVSYD
ncbi:hypothetical protein [Pseudomonas chlororaphis]|uniref:hypothetical protein n=1 Tax=Pseudomonas chlororaphis TaxID=587753 RepID=UPI0024085B2A|nr:hypothetical protein [Pseudomonas chlororaphis]